MHNIMTSSGQCATGSKRESNPVAAEATNPECAAEPLPVVTAMVLHCAKLLAQEFEGGGRGSGLVVGCGTGDEVVYLNRVLPAARCLGFDIHDVFSAAARQDRCVFVADATNVPLPADSFDFVAAFHSLEHVGEPELALDEIRRILRPNGWLYVGVPNKTRLLGYVGSCDASPWQKITWNAKDWMYRVRGRFENRLGAHAGFAGDELVNALAPRFSDVRLITQEYLRFKYQGRLPAPLLDLLLSPAMINHTAPSHYAICRKPSYTAAARGQAGPGCSTAS